jgi:hypothetical protein
MATLDPTAARSGAVTSTNPNYRAAWLCYINGIEVPIAGFSVNVGVWQVPQFQIFVPPDAQLEGLGEEDRVPVVLFYLDQWLDAAHPDWRLLIDGEIVAETMTHAAGQRLLSFTCLASLNVFDSLYFYFMNTVDDIVAAQSPEIAAAGMTAPGLFYPYSLFHQGLTVKRTDGAADDDGSQTDSPADDVIKAPFELVYNVIKGVIDKNVPNENRAVPMMNFFARYIRKTRFQNRFARLPLLEDLTALNAHQGVFPIFNAARNTEALSAMQRQTANRIGNSGTVWDLFRQTLGSVFMEVGTIPNPACVITNLDGEIQHLLDDGEPIVDQNTSGKGATTGQTSAGSKPIQPVRLPQYFAKPQFMFGMAPHCNVVFPSMFSQWTYETNIAGQLTRLYVNDAVMTRLMNAQGANREFMLHALTVAWPEEADAVLRHAHTGGTDGDDAAGTQETGKDLLIPFEEYYKGPVVGHVELPEWFQILIQTRNAATGSEPGDPAPTTGGSGDRTHKASTTQPAATTTGATRSPAPAPAPVARSDSATGANAAQPDPPRLPARRARGRAEGPAYWPNAYRPSDRAVAVARDVNVQYNNAPRVSEVPAGRATHNADGSVQMPVTVGIRRLGAFLQRMFPQIQQCGYTGYHSQNPDPNTRIDIHCAGRAVDLMIRTRRGEPDHEAGDPVANWLVEHAQEIGVQYFIWARTQFSAGRAGDKFSPYTRSDGITPGASGTISPHLEKFDHFNHIHLELNLEGSRAETPWFSQNSGSAEPAQPASAAVNVPGRADPAPTQPATRTVTQPARPGGPRTITVTRPAATPVTGTNEATGEPSRDESFQSLFRMYAQYEYLRQRYSKRTASATTVFNPYLVVGFPCVVLDAPRTSQHRVAYLTNYSHTASSDGNQSSWGTTMSMTCVRRFSEFLNDIKNDCERFAERVTAAPAEIIPEIRHVMQDDGQAEVFYQKFLYGGSRPDHLPAAFHIDRVMGFVNGDEVVPIRITGESVASAARIREAANAAAPTTTDATSGTTAANAQRSNASGQTLTVSHNIEDPNRELTPLPDSIYVNCFDRTDTALQMVARPVCTLEQYVRFMHGGKTIQECISQHHVEGKETDFTYAPLAATDVTGATADGHMTTGPVVRQPGEYWRRIYRLRPGPGPLPEPAQRGYVTNPAGPSETRVGLPANYPQTRAPWDEVLLAYREAVRSRVSPNT